MSLSCWSIGVRDVADHLDAIPVVPFRTMPRAVASAWSFAAAADGRQLRRCPPTGRVVSRHSPSRDVRETLGPLAWSGQLAGLLSYSRAIVGSFRVFRSLPSSTWRATAVSAVVPSRWIGSPRQQLPAAEPHGIRLQDGFPRGTRIRRNLYAAHPLEFRQQLSRFASGGATPSFRQIDQCPVSFDHFVPGHVWSRGIHDAR